MKKNLILGLEYQGSTYTRVSTYLTVNTVTMVFLETSDQGYSKAKFGPSNHSFSEQI